jgi:hypothetical protein
MSLEFKKTTLSDLPTVIIDDNGATVDISQECPTCGCEGL